MNRHTVTAVKQRFIIQPGIRFRCRCVWHTKSFTLAL
ncbi:uncharacterized protein METZ01_LOCUS451875, partial [marine metagenome]